MAGLTPAHLLIILVIALIVVGPGKLPEVGAAIGRSVREFQKATSGLGDSLKDGATQAPQAQAQVLPPTQPYYAAQPGYPAPGYQPQPGYPAPIAQPPVQYQPVVGVVEPAPTQPTPMSYPQPNSDAQQTPPSQQAD
jgi:sec-independent protein translocase protein TatA